MLTLKLISEETERVVRGLEKKHFKGAREAIEKVLEYDKLRRETQQKLDNNKQQQNLLSKQIGQLMKDGKKDEANSTKEQVAELKCTDKALQEIMEKAQQDMTDILLTIPNIPNDDQLGTFVTDFFEKEGIDTSRVKRCENGEKIGLTFTEIKSETESSIVMYRNDAADLKLEVSDIDEEYIKQGKALLISGTALCESPSREAALKAVMLAKRNCIPIIFDIDYRAYNWKNDDEISIYYSAVAREADIILGSREEYDLTEKLIKQGMSDEETAKYWHSQNAKIVVIKHGKEGSTAYTNDGESYNIKPFPVKLLKSFGGRAG